MRDLHSNIGANGTVSGKVIDRKGYAGVEFIASYGAVTTTGSVVTLVVKEGDATGSMTSVADANLLGTETLASLPAATPRTSGTSQNVTKRVGYVGTKRYVTVDAVKSGVTSVGCVAVSAVLFGPANAPVANP
jgi:hypothetical protein